jgi:glycosyltransferase involved in cell wall biosynthesis
MKHLVHFAEDGDTSGFFPAIAKYHDRSRYRLTFSTLRPMEPRLRSFMEAQGVRTFSCNARGRLAYGAALVRLVQRLRADPCEIFHAHLFDPSIVGLTGARLARVPLRVLTRHYSNYHTRINRPLHVKMDQLCTALSHRIIAVSKETAQHLVDVEGAPASKVTVVHNGIDFDRVRLSDDGARQRIRREIGGNEAFLFLIAARLHPEKGYEYLFEAVRLLRNRIDLPFLLLIAGRGPLLGHYQSLAASLNISDRVRFLGFRSDLPDLMSSADLFVLPSVAESFGLVLAEAIYLGLPVLASRVGGIPEIIDDRVDGLLVPPADPEALARGMESFLRRDIQLPGSGEKAVQKVRARFSFETMLRAYEAVYERPAGDSGRS